MAVLTTYQEKALDYKKHISLTANAGSGKTFVLSKRYLRIAIEESIPLRNIAAITFTDKAAGELYKKIALQIEENLLASKDESEKRKLEYIRRQLVSANISTIHSFCIDILKEHPVEAGLDANFIAIDEQISGELIELSVEEMIRASIKNPAEADILKYLIRIFASKSLFAGEIISLIKNRKNVLNFSGSLYAKTEEEIADYFYKTFIEFADKIIIQRLDAFLQALKKVNDAVLDDKPSHKIAVEVKSKTDNFLKLKTVEDKLKLLFEIKSLISTKNGGIKARDYLNSGLKEGLHEPLLIIDGYLDELKYFAFEDSHKEIEIELAKFGKTLIHFFNIALANYTKKKFENGCLDYEDILLYTQKILEIENVREDVSQKFNYIMIDEYQDTNEIQYKIFLPILDQLKKGNLFVVGDEKQSIYMFRDAELEVFNRTKKNIEAASGKEALLTLPDSFRMAPAICLFTNLLFENLFKYPNLLYNEVGPSDLVCARNDGIAGGIEILLNCQPADDSENEIESVHEAELVARRIINLINSNPEKQNISWHDVAILCRKRKSFVELEKAFIKYNIPFLIVGGKGFFQRQTIYDVYNYFSFLSDEKDDTALVGILRSPFFSLSDTAIFEISLEHGDSLWEKLNKYQKENPRIQRLKNVLSENLKFASNYNIPFLLRKILNESDVLAVVANKPNGIQELANLEKLIKITIKFFSKGFKTLYDYVSFLRESIEQSEDESQAAITEEVNSVIIMTLHQAKGLEFQAVFLYKCNEVSSKNTTKSKKVSIDKNFGLLTKLPPANRYSAEYKSAPVIGLSNLIIRKKELAEIKRLLYVGITRAKSYLFLSASIKENNSFANDSFMGLLERGLSIDFDEKVHAINSDLKFLDPEKNSYYAKKIDVKIPVIKNIDDVDAIKAEAESSIHKSLLAQNICDFPEGEIVSATKLSVYKQCPMKYHLTYDLGFASLNSQFRRWRAEKGVYNRYEFTPDEDVKLTNAQEAENRVTLKEYADVKGTIIHKLLQNEISLVSLEDNISSLLKNEISRMESDERTNEALKNEIVTELKVFLNSGIYKKINKYSDYKNEFEVYAKENDYYLYGIIDKFILADDKALIIDYKTDLLTGKSEEQKVNSYFTQLGFYAYIVSKLFPNIKKFEVQLIFVRYPERILKKEIGEEDFAVINVEIKKMILNTRKQGYTKNLNHCSDCSFSTNFKDCIVM